MTPSSNAWNPLMWNATPWDANSWDNPYAELLAGAGTNNSPTTLSNSFSSQFGNFLPWKNADGSAGMGWGMPLLNMGSSLLNGYLGFKQLGLAEDNLNFQKDAFSKQFENQRTLTNSELRDRQAARVASNPTAYQSVDDYMKANAV